jgi:hypothetical protein
MILSTHGFLASSGGVAIDPDALAFFGRVDTATSTTDFLTNTEKTAINKLVLDLKANSLWTQMKALYPMVGGGTGTSAQRQAACSQNLKSSSFTGTFTSTGWTFASTGVTPNPSLSAYFNTNLVPSTNLSQDSIHFGFYSRTTDLTSTSSIEIGSLTTSPVSYLHAHIYYLASSCFMLLGRDNTSSVVNTSSLGFFNGNRKNSTTISHFKNGTNLGDLTASSVALNPLNVFIGAGNINGNPSNYSNRECAFASIGDGYTDTQAATFYTAVQAFQTTLSRNV